MSPRISEAKIAVMGDTSGLTPSELESVCNYHGEVMCAQTFRLEYLHRLLPWTGGGVWLLAGEQAQLLEKAKVSLSRVTNTADLLQLVTKSNEH